MRERERARTCARGEDPVRDHELQLQSDGAIDGEIAIAPSIALRRDRDLGSRSPCRDHDRVVDRDRSMITVSDRDRAVASWSRSRIAIAISDRAVIGCISGIDDFFFLGCGLCFLICVFLLPFQTPENIFRKFFWNATKHMETFSFSGN